MARAAAQGWRRVSPAPGTKKPQLLSERHTGARAPSQWMWMWRRRRQATQLASSAKCATQWRARPPIISAPKSGPARAQTNAPAIQWAPTCAPIAHKGPNYMLEHFRPRCSGGARYLMKLFPGRIWGPEIRAGDKCWQRANGEGEQKLLIIIMCHSSGARICFRLLCSWRAL